MAKTGKAAGEGSFEESLKQLESLVEQMGSAEARAEVKGVVFAGAGGGGPITSDGA